MVAKAGLRIDHWKAIVVTVIEIMESMHYIRLPCGALVEAYGLKREAHGRSVDRI